IDSLGEGKIFSTFDFAPGFFQNAIHPDAVSLTAFRTSFGLCEWLRRPQAPSLDQKYCFGLEPHFIDELHFIECYVMYMVDAIAFDASPIAHVRILREFLSRLRTYDLKLSPSKACLGGTELDFLGLPISPAGLHPETNNVRAMAELSTPTNITQLRSLSGGLSYYRSLLPNLSKRICSITYLLQMGDAFVSTKDVKATVRDLLKTLAEKQTICFPDWEAAQDGPRLFQMHTDASIDGFGAVLNQPQLDGSVGPILYISRATLPNEVNCSPPKLDGGVITWAIKRLRQYLF
ncbi:unnamed protein product, partial [Sphacelaria rigidula]